MPRTTQRPRTNARRRALATAAQQAGLLARRQAPDVGVAPERLDKIAAAEGWRPVVRGVWIVAGAPVPSDLRLRAVLLAVGPPSAASRWTALTLHGLHRSNARLQIIVPHGRAAAGFRNVETLRSRTFDGSEVQLIDGIPTVGVERAIIDLAAIAHLDRLRAAVIDAIQRRLSTLEALARALLHAGAVRGRGKVRRILRELDSELVDSVFEFEVITWLRSLGHGVVAQHPLETKTGPVHLDIAITECRIAIEVQGFLAHSERRHLDIDAIRSNAIKGVGWEVVRITWTRFVEDRAGFLADLDDIIAVCEARRLP